MNSLTIIQRPSARTLRQFGWICAAALPSVGWMWGVSPSDVIALTIVGMFLASVGMAWPKLLWPIYFALTIIGALVGALLGEAALLCVFFGLFLPISLALRLFGRDALELNRDHARSTYWKRRSRASDAASYYRQS